jgi:hypothetical protein
LDSVSSFSGFRFQVSGFRFQPFLLPLGGLSFCVILQPDFFIFRSRIQPQPAATICNHLQPAAIICNQPQSSATSRNHLQPAATICNQPQPSATSRIQPQQSGGKTAIIALRYWLLLTGQNGRFWDPQP